MPDALAEPAVTAPAPAPRRRYGSRAMVERRRRILAEAQKMLEAEGVEGFTIRELSRRAGVAQRTLYNLFGSKEDIIASAIHQHFAGLLADVPPAPPSDDFEAALRRIDRLLDRTIEQKRYATAMVAVFFSPSADRRIYDSLRRISQGGSVAWVAQAALDGTLARTPPEDQERLATLMVNTSYANLTDWAAGRITAREMKLRFKMNFLICALPFAPAGQRTELRRLIERVSRGEAI